MVETAEATHTASNGHVGETGSPTSAIVATSPEEDATPRPVEFWRCGEQSMPQQPSYRQRGGSSRGGRQVNPDPSEPPV